MTGIEAIAAERQRQLEEEGWTPEHDDQHTDDSLALVAALYAAPVPIYSADLIKDDDGRVLFFGFDDPWPTTWDASFDKRLDHDRRRRLVIAGALIAADIDRLDRATPVIEAEDEEDDPSQYGEFCD